MIFKKCKYEGPFDIQLFLVFFFTKYEIKDIIFDNFYSKFVKNIRN